MFNDVCSMLHHKRRASGRPVSAHPNPAPQGIAAKSDILIQRAQNSAEVPPGTPENKKTQDFVWALKLKNDQPPSQKQIKSKVSSGEVYALKYTISIGPQK